MPCKFSNGASASLAAAVTSGATSVTVTAGQGALFPVLTGGDYFYATLADSSNNVEIVKVTARTGDTMAVVRGQDGTTARAFAVADKLELRPVAAALESKADKEGTAFTGDLSITKSNPTITLNKTAAAQSAALNYLNSGTLRWQLLGMNSAAESGGNNGSDFGLNRFADNGALLGTPVYIRRVDGAATFETTPYVGNNKVFHEGNIATAPFVSKAGDVVAGDLTVYRPSAPATGVLYLGNSGSRYLHWDGGQYFFGGAGTAWHSGNFNPAAYMPVGGGEFTGGVATAQINTNVYQGDSGATITIRNAGGGGDAGAAGIAFLCAGNYGLKMHLRNDGYFGIGGWSSPAWRWYVNCQTGDMVASGNIQAYSDPRLKDDVQPLPNALQRVCSLSGVSFVWNHVSELVGNPGAHDVGVLADQVEEVLPEAVKLSMADSKGERYKTVAYDKLVPLLIEAIKELEARVAWLEERC